ncbi:hypothetical protein BKA70DRAFT_1539015 [Coprinopsis sp. MPI-PUGE-AT-0042]|nr:hypothetical protein BKA70DRAFT_1539015 [Coprinopsis sp. MPI-PUGE-AT-0042]
MPQIPVNAIRKAKQPDASGKIILDLRDLILREEHAPLPALEAIFPHLEEFKLPEDTVRDATFVTAVDRGICAMEALEAWLRWGKDNGQPTSAATPKLMDAYPGILSWLKFLFSTAPDVGTTLPGRTPWRALLVIFVQLIRSLASWDKDTADCVFSSESTVTSLLEVWTYHPSDAKLGFSAVSTDVISDTMYRLFVHPSGRVNFLDTVMQSSNSGRRFCTGLEQRITRLQSSASHAAPETMPALMGILMVSFEATGISAQIRSMMHSRGYIQKISTLIVKMHPRIGKIAGFDVWQQLVAIAFLHGPTGIIALLDTGFFPLFINDMVKASRESGRSPPKGLWVLHKLMGMTHIPRCLPAIHRSILAISPTTMPPDQKAFRNSWRDFTNNVSGSFRQLQLLEKQGEGKLTARLCDFDMVRFTQTTPTAQFRTNPSRSIARWGTFSTQRQDTAQSPQVPSPNVAQDVIWSFIAVKFASMKTGNSAIVRNAQHCPDLGSRSGAYYSTSTRYFNIEAGRMSVSQKMPGFSVWIHHEFPGKDKRQIIITCDVKQGPYATPGHTIYVQDLRKHFEGRPKGDCAVLEERYANMIQEYTSHSEPPSTWLVDVAIPWGTDSILSQLIELLPTGAHDEDDNSICFVVGHAWIIEPMNNRRELSSLLPK